MANRLADHINAEPIKRAWIVEMIVRGAGGGDGGASGGNVVWYLKLRFVSGGEVVTHWSTFTQFSDTAAIRDLTCGDQSLPFPFASALIDHRPGGESSTGWMVACLPIRFGDDIAQRAAWFGYRYAFPPDSVDWLTK